MEARYGQRVNLIIIFKLVSIYSTSVTSAANQNRPLTDVNKIICCRLCLGWTKAYERKREGNYLGFNASQERKISIWTLQGLTRRCKETAKVSVDVVLCTMRISWDIFQLEYDWTFGGALGLPVRLRRSYTCNYSSNSSWPAQFLLVKLLFFGWMDRLISQGHKLWQISGSFHWRNERKIGDLASQVRSVLSLGLDSA